MRYHLAHSRDIKKNGWNNRCPSCGQRKFSPYIDSHTGKPIDEKHCGRCCRERSCAYHMTPSEWFKEHPQEKREWLPREQYVELMRQRKKEAEEVRKQHTNSPSVYRGSTAKPGGSCLWPLRAANVVSKRSAEQNTTRSACNAPALTGTPSINRGGVGDYLSHMSALCTRTRSDKNHLARWLCTQFPKEQVAAVLARYRTGSTRDGRIIYWQIDHRGQVRAGKVMAYNPDGHRRKEGNGNVRWVHSIKIGGIKFDEMLAPQCLFGEHLAPLLSPQGGKTPTAMSAPLPLGGGWEGALVESEKTALIMSLVCPDTVWLATGGKANFKEAMLWPLLGHEVAVYPDADALRDWEVRIHRLNRELGHRLYIPTGYYNLMSHEQPRTEGWDLADVIFS